MNTEHQTVLWLTPSEPALSFFRDTIRGLALEHNAPIFEPHLTLGRGSMEELRQIEAAPLVLPILGADTTEQFTKTLFVRFELTPPLEQLLYSLGMEAGGYDPHLSLLYKNLPGPRKRQLAASLSFPFQTVTFARAMLIRCPLTVSSRADVEAWETIATNDLT